MLEQFQIKDHSMVARPPRTAIGLFAGIGGFELGFRRAGIDAVMLCENDPAARSVLTARFPDVCLTDDVCELKALPKADLLAAGFPCTDLSQAGRTAGIFGRQSGLVEQIFRLLATADPRMHVILENVPFMLSLSRGSAMALVVERLEALDFRWAYRVVDTRSFGLPQRRRRVVLVASRTLDPADVVLTDDRGSPAEIGEGAMAGFYWTEGNRGLGWTDEGVPPLKGSSGLGIASPPAIWLRGHPVFVTPDLRDAEALQGFPRGWTKAVQPDRARWKLVGNAVSVPVAEWLARRLQRPGKYRPDGESRLVDAAKWPSAARGARGERFAVSVSEWPLRKRYRPLSQFLREDGAPLSQRAAAGFLKRATASSLHFEEGFLKSLKRYLDVELEAATAP